MADPNGFHSDYSDAEEEFDFEEFESSLRYASGDILKAKGRLQQKIQEFQDNVELSDQALTELETINNSLQKYDELTAEIEEKIKVIAELQKVSEESDETDSLEEMIASWQETERKMQELAAVIGENELFHNAHKSVKRLAKMENRGEVLEEIHTLPAEKKLYAAIDSLKEEHRLHLEAIIGASPRKSQIVSARFVILKAESDVTAEKSKPLYNKLVEDVILCSDTTFRDVMDSDRPKNIEKSFSKYGQNFKSASASFLQKRLLRKNKRFIARVDSERDLGKRIIDSTFQYTDSKGRTEKRDFPLERDFRNKVVITFIWLGR